MFYYFKGIKDEALELFAHLFNPESTANIFVPNCKLVTDAVAVIYGAKSKYLAMIWFAIEF